ncbi:phytoene/squalene synthase family protein [Acidiphilium sp.]|uniref:phytoene/squalene synthase family protein n=1 Tax=Acidiphilium sp. TaxID=527 RepID=UPI003D0697AA
MSNRTDHPDLATCHDLLRGGSFSFHAASRLLPSRIRNPATALYAFCRIADDAVDEGADKSAAVALLAQRLDRAYRGRPDNHPIDRAFTRMIEANAIPRTLPDALIEGLAWDAEGRRHETSADARAYAARVAGSVGAMMTLIMGRRDSDSLAAACDLGVAMQFTNIARDVGEDARAGRLYLPLDWLAAESIDPAAFLAAPRLTPALARVIARLLEEAETFYDRALPGIARLPRDCRPGIHAARMIYRAIGRALARAGYDSITTRARVAAPRKLGLAGLALSRALLPTLNIPAYPCAETRFLIEAAAQPLREPVSAGARVIMLIDRLERIDRRHPTKLTGLSGDFACPP